MIYQPTNRSELIELVNDLTVCLGDIDTSKVQDFSQLFRHCMRVDYSGIETWDVSHVLLMDETFYGSLCNEDLNRWNPHQVQSMKKMFMFSKFNCNLNSWNVSKCFDMSWMFYGSEFNSDLSKWDVRGVSDMSFMFADSRFNQNINCWDVSKVDSVESMFSGSSMEQSLNKWKLKRNCNIDNFVFHTKWNSPAYLPRKVKDKIHNSPEKMRFDYPDVTSSEFWEDNNDEN